MTYISYDHTSLHASTMEVVVHYHVRRALLGGREHGSEPHREVIDAAMAGPLGGAMHTIREWATRWAPKVAPGFDQAKGPEIALSLNVTSKGNLEVTWIPVMTQDQYDAAPGEFKRWMEKLSHRPIAQRPDEQLYFIREIEVLHRRLQDGREGEEGNELDRISAVALAIMMAELPARVGHLVNAHWQDVLLFDFIDKIGSTPTSRGLKIIDAWEHFGGLYMHRLDRALDVIGIDADRLEREWNSVAATNPRVRTDAGRSKIVASVLQVRPDQVDSARTAIVAASTWSGDKPDLWWNRTDPYPRSWGTARMRN